MRRATLDALKTAHPGIPVVLSAAFESGVGIAALAREAARETAPPLAAGLDTYRCLERDILRQRLPEDQPFARLSEWQRLAAGVDRGLLLA